MFYDFQNNMTEYSTPPKKDYFAIIPIDKANDFQITKYYSDELHTLLMHARFSKIEIFSDYIYGTLNIPEILLGDNTGFSFIYTSHYLIFIDKNNYIPNFNTVNLFHGLCYGDKKTYPGEGMEPCRFLHFSAFVLNFSAFVLKL